MLNHFGIVCEEFKALHQEESETDQEIEWAVGKNRNHIFQVRSEFLPVEVKPDIIVNCLYKGIKSERVAEAIQLDKQQVENIIYEFNTIKRARKKIRKIMNLRRKKLNKRYWRILQTFSENNLERGFILEQARKFLLDESRELNYISL